MKKTGIKSRILTAFLAASMILSSGTGFKAGVVNAAGNGSQTGDSEVITVEEEGLNQGNNNSDEFKKSNLKINFTVLESDKVTTPVKKKYVVVDIGKEGVSIENPVLVLEKSGKQYTFPAKKVEGTSLLFYPEFANDSYTGIYIFKSIQYSSKGVKYEKKFADDGIDTRIGVNKKPINSPDAYLTESTGSNESAAKQVLKSDNSVKGLSLGVENTVTLGFNGVNKNLVKKVSALKSTKKTSGVKGSNAPGNIVIVLDPGHGGPDTGATRTWNGKVYEERTIVQKIANYCKAALEKNEGVTVYLTRSSIDEPERDDDLHWRCQYAYEMGADLFVSLHINAVAGDVTVSHPEKGAIVFVPNANYNSKCYNVGKAVGTSIAKQLKKLGITNSTTQIWNTEKNSKYPDGSPADYLAVIRHCKEYGIPGMLVEHDYVSNASECEKFFGSDAKIKALGEADAAGIAENIGLIQQNRSGANSTATGWQKIGGQKVYYDADGNIKTGFFTVKGKTYYANTNGYVQFGWQLINGSWYCFNDKGHMFKKSFQKNKNGELSYLGEDGKMAIGITKTDKGYYMFDSDGYMLKGWQEYNKAWYYMDSTGLMYRGRWLKQNGNKFYLKADGKMAKGFINKKGKRYFLNKKGILLTGWQKINNKWYLFDGNGVAKTSEWYVVEGKKYYFSYDSRMATGPTRIGEDMYFFAKTGEQKTGWIKNGVFWYHSGSDGKLNVKQWYTEGKKKYYFDEKGKMATGTKVIDGKTYKFKSNGELTGTKNKTTFHPIMAKSKYTAADMVKNFNNEGYKYPSKALKKGGAKDISAFCQIIYEEAEAEGVNAELVYAQIMNETGWLQFGGDVKIDQFNFCGLGAVGGGVAGCSFPDVRTGIRAQVQHLKAYGSTQALNNACVDPRFQYVERGCAKYIEYLGIKENPKGKGWATAESYGYRLLNIIYSLQKTQ